MVLELKEVICPRPTQKKEALEENFPFKSHAQLPQIADAFYRLYQRHVILYLNSGRLTTQYYCNAVANYLSLKPRGLKNIEFYDVALASFNPEDEAYLIGKLVDLTLAAHKKNKVNVFLFKDLSFFKLNLSALLNHPSCRFLVATQQQVNHPDFASFEIDGFNAQDDYLILKKESEKLTAHHHVLISDEVITAAYKLTQRFLGFRNVLENTLALLDSSTARLYSGDESQSLQQALCLSDIKEVLSDWVCIPPQMLSAKIKPQEVTQSLQSKVLGQESAITLLAQELHQAQVNLSDEGSTFTNLLLAGAKHSGKKTLTIALAELLYQSDQMVFRLQNVSTQQISLAEVKFQSYTSKQYSTLKDILSKKPYAILLIEEVEQLPPNLLDELQEALNSGTIRDNTNNSYCLKNTIFVFTTTLGTTRLSDIHKKQSTIEEKEDIDLVKLVMNEEPEETMHQAQLSPQQLTEEMAKEIASYIPAALLQHLCILPFFSPDKAVIENILRLKLKNLGRALQQHHEIELGYAPEVIRYLSFTMTKKHEAPYSIDKIIKSLSSIIEQAIANKDPARTDMNQLLLQLNETGQMIRADWLSKTDHAKSSSGH